MIVVMGYEYSYLLSPCGSWQSQKSQSDYDFALFFTGFLVTFFAGLEFFLAGLADERLEMGSFKI